MRTLEPIRWLSTLALLGLAGALLAATLESAPGPKHREDLSHHPIFDTSQFEPATTADAARGSPLKVLTPANPEASQAAHTSARTPERVVEVTVQQGEALYHIFKRHNLTPTLYQLLKDEDIAQPLQRVYPGQVITLQIDAGDLVGLSLAVSAEERLRVTRTDAGFQAERQPRATHHQRRRVAATIDRSLYLDGLAAGLSDRQTLNLAKLFAWDIDFALDIRRGDRFELILEEAVDADGNVLSSEILAARFVNGSQAHTAVRSRSGAYYSHDGYPLKRAFLRSPVEFTRISSHFNPGRLHPILHRIRAHRGVDYAAPTGTPVRATADGRVAAIGPRGGYGKRIVLDHGNGYTTMYAHLSRYASALREGSRVKQRDVIGFVGMTGMATGPHLHYEFRIEGVHKDPLTVELPQGERVSGQTLAHVKERWEAFEPVLVGELQLADARH